MPKMTKECGEWFFFFSDHWLIVEAFLIIIILVINVLFVAVDDIHRQREMLNKAKGIIHKIKGEVTSFSLSRCAVCASKRRFGGVVTQIFFVWIISLWIYQLTVPTNWKWLRLFCLSKMKLLVPLFSECSHGAEWTSSQYINLHAPQSQCISLQWTYRDETVVNLPVTLLVEGDVILLRPGQKVPVKCRKLYVSCIPLVRQIQWRSFLFWTKLLVCLLLFVVGRRRGFRRIQCGWRVQTTDRRSWGWCCFCAPADTCSSETTAFHGFGYSIHRQTQVTEQKLCPLVGFKD